MHTPMFIASLVAQMVKNLPAMWETWVPSLRWEDPLEKEMATHASILPGESHGQRSLAGYSPLSCKVTNNNNKYMYQYIDRDKTESLFCTAEGNTTL